jgi:hypothetical protein
MTFYEAVTFIYKNHGQIAEALPEAGASDLLPGSFSDHSPMH